MLYMKEDIHKFKLRHYFTYNVNHIVCYHENQHVILRVNNIPPFNDGKQLKASIK